MLPCVLSDLVLSQVSRAAVTADEAKRTAGRCLQGVPRSAQASVDDQLVNCEASEARGSSDSDDVTDIDCDLTGNSIFTSACRDIARKGARDEHTVVRRESVVVAEPHEEDRETVAQDYAAEASQTQGRGGRATRRGRGFDWRGVHFTRSTAPGAKERFQVRCPCLRHSDGAHLCNRTAIFDGGTEDLVIQRLKYWLVQGHALSDRAGHMKLRFPDSAIPTDGELDDLMDVDHPVAPGPVRSSSTSSSPASSSSSASSDSSASSSSSSEGA